MSEAAARPEPASVAQARQAVEANRSRMSETLDELEDRLVEQKEALQRKVDVPARLRDKVLDKPWTTVGIAFGVGLAFGVLTGGRRRAAEYDGDDFEGDFDDDDAINVRYVDKSFGFWKTVRAQLVGAAIAAITEAVHERIAGPAPRRARRAAAELDDLDDAEVDEIMDPRFR